MKISLIFFTLTFFLSQAFSGNVLVLCPMCSISHKSIIVATVEALAKRNHSITIVSSFKTPVDSPNIRDVIVMDGFDYFSDMNIFQARRLGVLGMVNSDTFGPTLRGCHTTYQNPEFMKLLNQTFHLIFIDAFANHCLHGFAYRLKAPVIRSIPMAAPPSMAMQVGNYLPHSFVPEPMLPFGEKMNLLERIINLGLGKLLEFYYYSWYPEYEKIYRHYLGEDIPGLLELESEFSMVLVNSHFSINRPRPTMPNVVDVGGVHCRSGRPLPKDLEEFISGANEGLIVFSLGSIFQGKDMPEETREAFFKAFSKLKQKVVMKWDFNTTAPPPPNVKFSEWLPLQDILAHRNTKLFITHGGLLSTQEAIYHGVPLVGVPLFADQDLNIKRYVDAGVATFIEILSAKEEDISGAINTVLNNRTYKTNVLKMSKLFRDQPMSAIETAVFWSEYVMRHEGAPQLLSIARKLSYIEFHSLDVIAILSLTTLVSLSLFALVVMKLSWKFLKIVKYLAAVLPGPPKMKEQ